MALQRTFVMIKPDGVERGLVGECIRRFEQVGLKIIGMKLVRVDKEFSKKHYTEDIARRRGEEVRQKLVEYIAQGPVVALAFEGVDAIALVRKLTGDTEPAKASPGTIRGDYAHTNIPHANDLKKPVMNLIHASSEEKDAKAELALWFEKNELCEYHHNHAKYIS